MIRAISAVNHPKKFQVNPEFREMEPVMIPVKETDFPATEPAVSAKVERVFDRNDFILIKNEYKMINLQVKDILFIEGKGNYVSLNTTKAKILTLQTMKNLELFLLPYMFVRVHKSFLISFHHVEAIDNNTIWIKNMEIPIGDSCRESLRMFLDANTKQI